MTTTKTVRMDNEARLQATQDATVKVLEAVLEDVCSVLALCRGDEKAVLERVRVRLAGLVDVMTKPAQSEVDA